MFPRLRTGIVGISGGRLRRLEGNPARQAGRQQGDRTVLCRSTWAPSSYRWVSSTVHIWCHNIFGGTFNDKMTLTKPYCPLLKYFVVLKLASWLLLFLLLVHHLLLGWVMAMKDNMTTGGSGWWGQSASGRRHMTAAHHSYTHHRPLIGLIILRVVVF